MRIETNLGTLIKNGSKGVTIDAKIQEIEGALKLAAKTKLKSGTKPGQAEIKVIISDFQESNPVKFSFVQAEYISITADKFSVQPNFGLNNEILLTAHVSHSSGGVSEGQVISFSIYDSLNNESYNPVSTPENFRDFRGLTDSKGSNSVQFSPGDIKKFTGTKLKCVAKLYASDTLVSDTVIVTIIN